MAVAQAKSDATEARLAALSLPVSGGWTHSARADALGRLRAMGLPNRRDEYWKYTLPDSLVVAQPLAAAVFKNDEPALYGDTDRLKIVFVDGQFDASASDDLELAGLEIERLETAGAADIHWARDLYGVLESRGQTPVQRPLAALNSAFASDGVLIRATGKAAKPVNLIYLHNSDSSDAYLHHCIRVENGADLTILENGPAAARLNKVMEVDVADGAAFHHVRAQGRDHERRAVTHIFARLGRESTFKSFTMTVNGVLTRNELSLIHI